MNRSLCGIDGLIMKTMCDSLSWLKVRDNAFGMQDYQAASVSV
jgi:hypothetical protein